MRKNNRLFRMILAAFFLALAYVMPFLTGQIQEVGAMLCPLHIPVLLCGYICGPIWGLVIGCLAPVLRSFMLGMPPLFPNAVCMAVELAVYGLVAGWMHRMLPRKKPFVYVSLLSAMTLGRLVWGVAMMICMGIKGGSFTLSAFFAGAVVNALPGIVTQIVLIPILVMVMEHLMSFDTAE